MSVITDEIRAKATEYYTGDEKCQEKSKFLLTEMGLPNGLLPLQDMEECGYIEETGFVWLKQKKNSDHRFEKVGKQARYAAEVTAYVEKYKIKKLTGVKVKELLMWVTISDIVIDDPASGKITFKTPTGLSRTFPVSAFQIEEPPKHENKQVVKDAAINGENVAAAAKDQDESKEEKVEVKDASAAAAAAAVAIGENAVKDRVVKKQVEVKEV